MGTPLRGAFHNRDAMTLTVKNPADSNSPGQSPRSNPVCLELAVTIRSLPNEAGGQAQPIREEGRTVIVFDNGAVLRTTSILPVGQTVIVSNPNGRDVVCRVVGGRNLPSVKGYAEVEFVEPAKDFWGIHRDADSVAVAPPPAPPLASREPPMAPPQVSPRAALPLETPAKPASVSLGRGPSFEDIPGLLSAPLSPAPRETKAQSPRLGPERIAREESDYSLSGAAQHTSVANWQPPETELPTEKRAIQAMKEALSAKTQISNPAPPRDFMGKGLMAYEKPRPSSSTTIGRAPLLLGLATFVLAGVGGVVFYMHRSTGPAPIEKSDAVMQPSVPKSQSQLNAPQHGPVSQEESAQAQSRTQAQPVAADQAQPASSFAAVPAVVTSTETGNSRTEPGNVRRQEENAAVTKQPNLSSARHPAIPNLKIGAPSAPAKKSTNLDEGAAPITEVASSEPMGGATPAGLLTSSGRTSNPPAPPLSAPESAPVPASAPAPKTLRDAKLISSTRPTYPATARQSGIQGTVTVAAYIDESGKVAGAWALNGPMLLRQAAVDAVKQWKYSPATADGKPVSSKITVGVEFRLQ